MGNEQQKNRTGKEHRWFVTEQEAPGPWGVWAEGWEDPQGRGGDHSPL